QLARAPLARAAGLLTWAAGAAGFWKLATGIAAPMALPVVDWLSAPQLAPELFPGEPVLRVIVGVAVLVGLVLLVRTMRQIELWGQQLTVRVTRRMARRRRRPGAAAVSGDSGVPSAAPELEPPPRWPRATHLMRQMLLWSALTLGLVLVLDWTAHRDSRGPIWPLLFAFAGFLYLWRLGAIMFDLGYIWHRYIRWSRSSDYLREAVYSKNECKRRAAEDRATDNEPDDVPDIVGER